MNPVIVRGTGRKVSQAPVGSNQASRWRWLVVEDPELRVLRRARPVELGKMMARKGSGWRSCDGWGRISRGVVGRMYSRQ